MSKIYMKVQGYDEGVDRFQVVATDGTLACEFDVPGLVMPALVREYGEPSELQGRSFLIDMP